MNTIPLTFNQRQINYTVINGRNNNDPKLASVTCLLLNRNGSQFRNMGLENLVSKGFADILCAEHNDGVFNYDSAVKLFPTVKFVVTQEDVTDGDLINIAVRECNTPYFLVLYDDMCSTGFSVPSNQLLRMAEMNQFCIVPRLQTNLGQNIPVRYIPSVNKSVFKVDSVSAINDGVPTFYAVDWAGFYSREKYIQLGGADWTIQSSYWQKLDLFFRGWLWGEQTSINTGFNLSYAGDLPEENRSPDQHYLRFYLKNLLPVYMNDHGTIKGSSFFSYKARSKENFRDALEAFKDARNWTEQNKYRFKTDAQGLIENWGKTASVKN